MLWFWQNQNKAHCAPIVTKCEIAHPQLALLPPLPLLKGVGQVGVLLLLQTIQPKQVQFERGLSKREGPNTVTQPLEKAAIQLLIGRWLSDDLKIHHVSQLCSPQPAFPQEPCPW